MKEMWAPWRFEYIANPKPEGCFICNIFSENDDRENLILKRGETCGIMMNRYPYNNGHLMVAPYRHINSLEGLTQDEQVELIDLTNLSIRILRETMQPQGFNVGINLGEAAGAGLKEHVHQHIVPRWSGDTNFMPVLGDIKVMPEHLLETWDKLKAAIGAA